MAGGREERTREGGNEGRKERGNEQVSERASKGEKERTGGEVYSRPDEVWEEGDGRGLSEGGSIFTQHEQKGAEREEWDGQVANFSLWANTRGLAPASARREQTVR